ncbi:MAG: TetR/AcrR family transcriptional regulator [Chloroflexi bacterium]|nr:TetR/AcrR family transcriptional regulator [Chloroflexota bacterium]MCL5734962.1 TetR/AcrR family transcriptional regulator [Actinomycetota bacterium]
MQVVATRTPARRGRWTKEQRRAQVAAVTLEIIAREGVRAATLVRIAEAAGIATPSLYNHFSGRTEILEAASDLLLDRVLAWLDSSSNPNMFDRLRELGGSVHESRIVPDHEWVIMPLFELAVAARGEGLTERMRKNQMVVLGRFIDVVEEGKRQGTIREDADPEVVGWSLMGLGWTKDFALLEGLDQFVEGGTADKILENILDRIAP